MRNNSNQHHIPRGPPPTAAQQQQLLNRIQQPHPQQHFQEQNYGLQHPHHSTQQQYPQQQRSNPQQLSQHSAHQQQPQQQRSNQQLSQHQQQLHQIHPQQQTPQLQRIHQQIQQQRNLPLNPPQIRCEQPNHQQHNLQQQHSHPQQPHQYLQQLRHNNTQPQQHQQDQQEFRQAQVMANLNFQQAPRNLSSGGVGGRVGSGLVGAVSGHVTPTFGGALSPGRGSTAMPGGAPPSMASRTTLFGQRAFADRRVQMPSGLSQTNSNSMQSSMGGVSRYSAGGSYHSVFGEGGDTSTPPLLDLSEFPSLTARGAGDQAPAAAPPPPGTKPYVGMVKQPTAEQCEFQMSSEDFPALPGTAPGQAPPPPQDHPQHHHTEGNGIRTHPDGKVTNIPESMIPNQFGIVGLLTFIRAAESDPSLVSLALGQDLTALGLNLNSPDNLYLTFAGPWADAACRPQDMDYHVPPEYLINGAIREKLAPLRLARYKEDLLFYLFYCFVGDALQLAAAAELYNREWRYHTEEKVWISQAPGMPMLEKTSTYERGTYYFFDAHNWRKVAKEFHLDYSKLEGRPQLPPHVLT